MSHPTQGLLFALGQCAPDISIEKFNDWLNNEHVPDRLAVPGIHSATRYKAVDGEKPEWLSIYDMDSPNVVETKAYLDLREKASANERDLMPRLPVLQRRIYEHIAEFPAKVTSGSIPGKYVLMITWDVPSGQAEKEYNDWYDNEHMADVAKTPGWIRGRRYKLVDGKDLVGEGPSMGTHMVIHDWEHGNYWDTPEFQSSIQTPLAKKILGSTTFKARKFELYKNF